MRVWLSVIYSFSRWKSADIKARDDIERTILHDALQYGQIDIVQYLVSKSANKSADDKYGKSTYNIACDNYSAKHYDDDDDNNDDVITSQRDLIRKLQK